MDESPITTAPLPETETREISPEPPPWVSTLLEGADETWDRTPSGNEIRVIRGPQGTLVSLRVEDAVDLSAADFERATEASYQELLTALEDEGHIVRLWNSIPAILEPLGDLPHRYMVFNAGRYNAFAHWYQTHEAFPTRLATASGTGHFGADLVLHALATPYEGRPLENPRQVPSYRYSFRYGPRPPAFARATHLNLNGAGPGWLLVGGTASIVGEDCTNIGDLDAQTEETALNLEALVKNAYRDCFGQTVSEPTDDPVSRSEAYDREVEDQRALALEANAKELLSRFRHLRVYYPNFEDAEAISRLLRTYFGDTTQIEMVHSHLCRPELLIEIEGLAELPRSR
jgi:enamine deaminase RidA (YjgF/YER057c/UK114 family)